MTTTDNDFASSAEDLRRLAARLDKIGDDQASEESAALRRRLQDLEAAYEDLTTRYIDETSVIDNARRRFAMVLAQLVNTERFHRLQSFRSSPGQKLGAILDTVIYSATYTIGYRRSETAMRIRMALWDHWPGLFAWIQRRRGRPAVDLSASSLENAVYDEIRDEDDDVLRLRNLFTRRGARETLGRACRQLMATAAQYGPVTHMYALNFNAAGGAELVTQAYARLAAREGGTVCLVLTDPGPRVSIENLPPNIVVVDAGGDPEVLDAEERSTFVFLLWQTAAPEIFHVVNSEAAWRLISTTPRSLLPDGKIAASIFALQFDNERKPIGYAAAYLPAVSDRLDILLTDNARFRDEGPDVVQARIEAGRRHVAPTPSRLEGVVSERDALGRLDRRLDRAGRFTIVWAGRLDREKRIDLLLEIADAMSDRADFLVFGQSVIDKHDAATRLTSMSNVRMMGFYSTPLAWDEAGTVPNAFLFTSVWEGMPNTVIEAGWLGLPVVASIVGGVGSLIDLETGWPVDADAGASDYVAALDAIRMAPKQALQRTTALTRRVHEAHTQAAFNAAVEIAYGASDLRGEGAGR